MSKASIKAAKAFIEEGDGRFVIPDLQPPFVVFAPAFARHEGRFGMVFGDGARWREIHFDKVAVEDFAQGRRLRFHGSWCDLSTWTLEHLTIESAQRLNVVPEVTADLTPGQEASEIVFANEFPLPR
jgi:hypothetical protein